MTFRVGQKVVCIKRGTWEPLDFNSLDAPTPRYGDVCTIERIDYGDGFLWLTLSEFSPQRFIFDASRFRPVVERKTDISIFEAMLSPDRAAGKPRKRSLVNHH